MRQSHWNPIPAVVTSCVTVQVVSLEGLDRLVLELQNATVGRSLQLCLQTALMAPQSTLVIAVQTCLLEHNVVGEFQAHSEVEFR
jgi:hypothetical protein